MRGYGRRQEETSARCELCNARLIVFLAPAPGSSTHVTCSSCGRGWTVNRLANGATKLQCDPQRRTLDCPSCGKAICYRPPRKGQSAFVIRTCFACRLRIRMRASDGRVVQVEPVRAVPSQVRISEDGTHYVPCPTCHHAIRLVTQVGTLRLESAVTCPKCFELLAVPSLGEVSPSCSHPSQSSTPSKQAIQRLADREN